MVRSEGNMSLKNPVTPLGIDPGTVRLVVQRLNHYTTPGRNKYICSPYGFTLWDPRRLECLLQYEIGKCVFIEADGCEIILGLIKLYNG